MVTTIWRNLDRSMELVPKGQAGKFVLHGDGNVSPCAGSVVGIFYRGIQLITDCIFDYTLSTIVKIFTSTVEQLIANLNEQRERIRAVPLEEFSDQAKRVGFVCEFVLAHQAEIQRHDSLKHQITDALALLIPGKKVDFPGTVVEMAQDVMGKIDIVLGWKLEELEPPALTDQLLRAPPNRKEITELPPSNETIGDLPYQYAAIVGEVDNPENSLWLWFLSQMPWSSLSVGKRSLYKMVREIQGNPHKHPYCDTEVFLKSYMTQLKVSTIPLLKKKRTLDELVAAARWCPPKMMTTSEAQLRVLCEITISLQDRFLIWKSTFIEQTILSDFLKRWLDDIDDRHNVHYLNAIYYKWGAELGVVGLTSPVYDNHRTLNLPFSREELFAHLRQAWNKQIAASIAAQVQQECCENEIREFLIDTVKSTLPSIENPDAFVREEYFDEDTGLLNNRGANRFLRAISASFPAPGSANPPHE